MILEIATFDIKKESLEDFKAACEEATKVISTSKGFVGIDFNQCLEEASKFVALISWQRLEDHTIGFRQSELFVQWRDILSPYFNEAPVALHYESFPKK
ncbi:antibiotic biosynthesis monooxygenase [Allomuricauda sp. NBRC 101325]|uniref:antibiotic biosynthesis monooxygenase family protein n=1 Tax=Allomuricauda sp. NBRC 101325 TaxID=1113758 RepID=UPI002552E35B|nr:antibiotic biosynthesis monooxygenase [Muricauda sp. NBRC 101325]